MQHNSDLKKYRIDPNLSSGPGISAITSAVNAAGVPPASSISRVVDHTYPPEGFDRKQYSVKQASSAPAGAWNHHYDGSLMNSMIPLENYDSNNYVEPWTHFGIFLPVPIPTQNSEEHAYLRTDYRSPSSGPVSSPDIHVEYSSSRQGKGFTEQKFQPNMSPSGYVESPIFDALDLDKDYGVPPYQFPDRRYQMAPPPNPTSSPVGQFQLDPNEGFARDSARGIESRNGHGMDTASDSSDTGIIFRGDVDGMDVATDFIDTDMFVGGDAYSGDGLYLTGESRQISKPGDSESLIVQGWPIAQEWPWQHQPNPLAAVGGHFPGGSETRTEYLWPVIPDAVGGFSGVNVSSEERLAYDNVPESALNQHTFPWYCEEAIDLDEPFGISTSASNENHNSHLSGSYPPTAGAFPSSRLTEAPTQGPKRRPRRTTLSNPEAIPLRTKPSVSPIRKRRRSGASNTTARFHTLSVIQESGHEYHPVLQPLSCDTPVRGKRSSKLPPLVAVRVRQKRADGTVCIKCRKDKATCIGDSPCDRCYGNKDPKSWIQPCTPAIFLTLVVARPCNIIFQRSLAHVTLDETRRVTETFPESFDLKEMLEHLADLHPQFNIAVYHMSGSSYLLDLEEFFSSLSLLKWDWDERHLELCQLFGKNKVTLKSHDWIDCVKNYDLTLTATDRLIQWCNMPSRATYYLVPAHGKGSRRLLNIEEQQDRKTILLAGSLNRFVCRDVEIKGYSLLQKTLADLLAKPGNFDAPKINQLLMQLGQILCALRSRLSWEMMLSTRSDADSLFEESSKDRLTKIMRSLYFYYFVAFRRRKALVDEPFARGVNAYRRDGRPIFDDFPQADRGSEESHNGFDAWMQRGLELTYAEEPGYLTTELASVDFAHLGNAIQIEDEEAPAFLKGKRNLIIEHLINHEHGSDVLSNIDFPSESLTSETMEDD